MLTREDLNAAEDDGKYEIGLKCHKKGVRVVYDKRTGVLSFIASNATST
jgi:hypothetical protein